MREIKYRGKRIDNSEWIEGLLLTNKLGTYIITEKNPHECTQYGYLEINEYGRVNPETVGQLTGLKDKNGKEIYEGDILFHSAEAGSVTVQAYGFERKWGKGEKFIVSHLACGLVLRHISAYGNSGYDTPNCIIKGWLIVDAYQFWNLQRGFEVIGNVFESPELLEVQA